MPIIVSGIIPVDLSQLHDVSITNPQNGQYLRYNNDPGVLAWQNSYFNTDVYNFLDGALTSSADVVLTFSPGTQSIDIGLASVAANVGTFGTENITPRITIDPQGRVRSVVNVPIANVGSASTLVTPRSISATGDAAWSVTFDGSTNVTAPITLATVNAAPQSNTFRKITVNNKGLVTATSPVVYADIAASLQYDPVNKAGDTMTGLLILSGDPVNPLGATTKQYVDGIAAGLIWKQSVKYASTTNIASLAGLIAVDGITVAAGDRILVKNQTTASQNGIYVASAGTWTRPTDADTPAELNGAAVYVQMGNTLADTGWTETATITTIGTDPILFVQFIGPGTYLAGTGISLTGVTFANTGVLSLTTNTGLSSNVSATGNVTITNTGVRSLVGTTNQVIVSASTGDNVTLSLPQNINTTAAPTFVGTNFSGNAASLNSGSTTTTAITNDLSTSATVYPTWVTANTGNLPQKVTSTRLTFNPLSGILSATQFTGSGAGLTAQSVPNSALQGSGVITIGGTPVSMGTTVTDFSGLTSLNVTSGVGSITGNTFYGSGAGLTNVPLTGLPGSGSLTIGSTNIPLGATALTLAGLTSVTSTTFSGALSGNATSATNIANGVAGNIPYQTTASTTALLPTGTTSQVLVSGATPSWTNSPNLTGTNFTNIPNNALVNSSIFVTGSTGLSVSSSSVSLGSNITLTNTGVTSLVAGTNISLSASTGSVTVGVSGTVSSATTSTNIAGGALNRIPYQTAAGTTSFITAPTTPSTALVWNGTSFVWSATGVTSLAGTANQVIVSASTGAVTLSLPQNINTTAAPTFVGTNFSGTALSLNIGGYKQVDNGNEMTLANGFAGGTLYLNYRGATSAITELRLTNGMSSGALTNVAANQFNGSGAGLTGTASLLSIGGNAATATNATNATNATYSTYINTDAYNMKMHWSGQPGQPTWLWGSNDGANSYVWNPSNFSVNYATSAGSATSATYASYLTGAPAYTNGTDGWWRSNGQAGWYNASYAVGIYATEVGNVRTYNGANFISGGTLAGTALTVSSAGTAITLDPGAGTTSNIKFNASSATRGYVYCDSGGFGFLNNSGGWAAMVPYGTSNLNVTGTLTATSVNATSTKRVKKAIKDLSKKYLDKFNDLRPREYDRKDYVAHEFGFIAEEVALIYPEVVGRDTLGKPSGIDYGKLSTILTAKVQEQQTKIDKLQEQMTQMIKLVKDLVK